MEERLQGRYVLGACLDIKLLFAVSTFSCGYQELARGLVQKSANLGGVLEVHVTSRQYLGSGLRGASNSQNPLVKAIHPFQYLIEDSLNSVYVNDWYLTSNRFFIPQLIRESAIPSQ